MFKVIDRLDLAVRRRLTLGTLMERLAHVHGDDVLVTQAAPDLSLTYRQAAKRVARWAGGIAARIEPGDRVVIASANTYEFFLLSLAASRAGGVVVPVNPQMRPEEVDHVVTDSGATLVVRDCREVDDASCLTTAVAAHPDDVAALFYTSGTTGLPKGARLTHQALVGQAAAIALWPGSLRRDEAVVALPLAHIMGFAVVTMMATAGVPLLMLPKFRPVEVLDAIEQRRATVFIGVPAMYRMMSEAGAAQRDLSSVRLWGSGADAMPADLVHEFASYGALATLPIVGTSVGDAVFAEGYGMVELGGGCAAKVTLPGLALPTDDFLGIPLPGYRFRVVDDEGDPVSIGEVGELLVTGPGLLRGYHDDPERSAEVLTDDGYLHTGDLARRGPFGLVAFAGRQKDVVMHGGYTIVAVEVEHKLESHPAVAEACVVGVDDEHKGEVPVAAIRLVDGCEVDLDELRAWAHEHMAHYKVPVRIHVVDDLPRNASNKVRKAEVRQLLAGCAA